MADNRQQHDASSRARHVRSAGDRMPTASPQQTSRQGGGSSARSGGKHSAAGSARVGAARYGNDMTGKRRSSVKKKGGPWRVVFWIALVVFIAAIVSLGAIAISYWQGQDKYGSLATQAFEEPSDIAGMALSDVVIDWDALRAINPEVVGWVYVPGTKVNYPITHTTDNDKYLTTDFLGEKNWLASYGSIFLAAENTGDFSNANNIVYGHHMNDGSMFAQFADFRDETTFNDHRTVYIFTPQRNYKLTTFSLVVVDASDPLAQPGFVDETEMRTYIQDKIDRSVVAPEPAGMAVGDMQKLFAFVTCSDYTATSDRIVLFASVADDAVPVNATGAAGLSSGEEINPEDAIVAEEAAKEIA